MKRLISVACAALLWAAPHLYAQDTDAQSTDAQKQALIGQLLDQVGQSSVKVGEQFSGLFIQQMTAMLRQSNPTIDPQAFVILEEEVRGVIREVLVDEGRLTKVLFPIYDRHFTVKELEEWVAFNDTPTGRKILEVSPQLTQEGIRAGEEIGQQLVPLIQQRVGARFMAEGILPMAQPQPAPAPPLAQ